MMSKHHFTLYFHSSAHPTFGSFYCVLITEMNKLYDESFCPSGAASLGKGIGGILFSRFSRSSGQVGGVEEEPSDSEGGVSEVENVTSGEEGATMAESEEMDKQIEEERREVEPAMSQSTSAVMDSTSCKYCALAGCQRVKINHTPKILTVSCSHTHIPTFHFFQDLSGSVPM